MKTALVTGACGLLGQYLVNHLKSKYKTVAVDIAANVFETHKNVAFVNRDLTESGAPAGILSEANPDIIYNCAAYTDVDGCETDRDRAYELNVKLVENLLDAGPKRLIQYSTDHVFNGERGPYKEDDETDPIGYYGETKLQSERITLNSAGRHLIIRTNVLFGSGINIRPNFVTWLMDNLRQSNRIKVVTDQYNNPIHADNLAGASIEAEESGLTGVLHLAGDSYLSRFELAVETADFFNFDRNLILPVKSSELEQIAGRPLRGGLKIDLAKRLLESRLLGFDEALGLMKIPTA
ncbi:MAG: SDR family oxidoreductase [Candidatus Zixiibacteriota bacterium]|nr:MAG: SDR family oxidoreductase [candidate division Zixibacteria bacterium]